MTLPDPLRQPLPRGQFRELRPTSIDSVLFVASWLDQTLKALCGRGRDPATACCIEDWRNHGGDLSALQKALSNDALLAAERKFEEEEDPAARERQDAADLRRRQELEDAYV